MTALPCKMNPAVPGYYRQLMKMDGDLYHYGAAALAIVTYGWVIRSYFSIVRRIKAGRLLRCSIIGTIVGGIIRGIGKLPSPLNVIVGVVILVVINGGLIYGVIFMRQYTVKGIPKGPSSMHPCSEACLQSGSECWSGHPHWK